MRVKFFLRNGTIVDWEVQQPEQFNFVGLCTSIRSSGFFLWPDIYIPHEQISFVALEGAAHISTLAAMVPKGKPQ